MSALSSDYLDHNMRKNRSPAEQMSVKTPTTVHKMPTAVSQSTTLKRVELNKDKMMRYQITTNQSGKMELNLSHYNLDKVPKEIVNFSTLEILSLSHNALRDIPGNIGRLRHLKVFYVNHNNLSTLPETLTNCTHLVDLNLTRNKLKTLPRNVGHLRNLKALRLGENKFESLPHDISQLSNLRMLDLHGNRIWYLPFSIHLLHKLQYLNMADNKFEHLPLPVCQVVSLRILNLRGNRLISLPQDFESLRNLQELNLSFNKFHIIPPAISKLRNLKYLNLAGNKIRHIPEFLGQLPNLNVLHLQFNQTENFPNGFPGMQHLNVADNSLTFIAVSYMKKLRHLNVSNNKLENLPRGIFNTTKMETLKLRGNMIKYVPHDLVFLKKLRVLDLGYNQLTTFPKIIDQMAKLDYFNIKGNDMHNPTSHQKDVWPQEYMVIKNNKSRKPLNRYRDISGQGQGLSLKLENSRTETNQSNYSDREKHLLGTEGQRFESNEGLDELLQNGFSLKRIHSNFGSVVQLYRKRSRDDINSIKRSEVKVPTNLTLGLTDFGLLGICNQVEMMLNKELLQPVLSLKRNKGGKSFGDKSIKPIGGGLWRLSNDKEDNPIGMIYNREESFNISQTGGKFISTVDPHVSLFIPTRAVMQSTMANMKIMVLELATLNKLKVEHEMIDNIISIGPIISLQAERDTEFKHIATMTIPSPPGDVKGHLNIVTIRKDNSCVPVAVGYRQKNGSITVNMWEFEGKVAVLTKAKCKYKACTSVEQLLQRIQSTQENEDLEGN